MRTTERKRSGQSGPGNRAGAPPPSRSLPRPRNRSHSGRKSLCPGRTLPGAGLRPDRRALGCRAGPAVRWLPVSLPVAPGACPPDPLANCGLEMSRSCRLTAREAPTAPAPAPRAAAGPIPCNLLPAHTQAANARWCPSPGMLTALLSALSPLIPPGDLGAHEADPVRRSLSVLKDVLLLPTRASPSAWSCPGHQERPRPSSMPICNILLSHHLKDMPWSSSSLPLTPLHPQPSASWKPPAFSLLETSSPPTPQPSSPSTRPLLTQLTQAYKLSPSSTPPLLLSPSSLVSWQCHQMDRLFAPSTSLSSLSSTYNSVPRALAATLLMVFDDNWEKRRDHIGTLTTSQQRWICSCVLCCPSIGGDQL